MKLKELGIIFFIFTLVVGIFFYKSIIHGYIPFPGDLLISEYNPWKTYSYLGYVPGSFPSKAQYFDVLRQLYPWKTLTLNQLRLGELPLWNPYNFSGSPLLANFQSAVFYPFNMIYFFFPQVVAWSILVILQPLLAGLFTLFYSRKIGLSKFGSFFAAISFAFSSFMTVWVEYNTIGHVILWLPLILLSIEHLIDKKTGFWMLIFVFSLVSSLLSGHIQIFVYMFTFVAFYCFFRILTSNKKIFLFLFLIPLGIGGVQLVSGLELIREAARSAHTYDFLIHKILIQMWQLVMIVVPDFFGNPATRNYWVKDTYVGDVISIGLVPLFFILITFFRKSNFFIRFFWVSSFVVLIFITNNPITQLLYHFDIPFISSSASNLAVFILCFSLSMLCGFGVDVWQKEIKGFKKYLYLSLPIFILFVGLWIIVLILPKLHVFDWDSNLSISSHNLFYSTILFVLALVFLAIPIFNKKLQFAVLICLLLLHGFDLWRSFEKFNPFSPAETVFPSTPIFDFLKENSAINRVWGYGTAAIEANFATQYGLYSADGYDPLYPKRYGEFIQASRDGKIQTQFTTQTRSDALITPGFGEIDLPSNVNRLKVLDLLGVKYVLDRVENKSTEKTFPKERFRLIYEKDGWKIFENLKALPRAFLASDYKVFGNNQEFEKLFFNKNFDPSKTILLEENPIYYSSSERASASESRSLSSVQLVSYKPNKISISTRTDTNQLLFLSDTYYSGWKAFVDGKEAKIYRADYAFRSINVPKGKHKINFVYDPKSFKAGFGISILSFTLLAIFLVRLTHRR